jgi:hypothetical protein
MFILPDVPYSALALFLLFAQDIHMRYSFSYGFFSAYKAHPKGSLQFFSTLLRCVFGLTADSKKLDDYDESNIFDVDSITSLDVHSLSYGQANYYVALQRLACNALYGFLYSSSAYIVTQEERFILMIY